MKLVVLYLDVVAYLLEQSAVLVEDAADMLRQRGSTCWC
jgi:hypothetical protein